MPRDTIAAVATPAGKGGVGIVRISGPKVSEIAQKITARDLPPRVAVFCDFLDQDADLIDQGLAIRFTAPASFTGEDVLELQGHGGPLVMALLLNRVVSLGARMARPGEFSERAFLNDKLDLAQAEAVADLIESSTLAAAKGALRSLKGEFSERVQELSEEILRLRMFTEAAIDFPEEEIDFLSDERLQNGIQVANAKLEVLLQQSNNGALLRDGLKLVLAGQPNAGKSSLMNRFVGEEVSIVTSVPGTTRDLIREQISIDGIPIKLVDTAGLRHSEDEIEQEGVNRAKQELTSADGVLVLVDLVACNDWQDTVTHLLSIFPDRAPEKILVVLNKLDLIETTPAISPDYPYPVAMISAKSGVGMNDLKRIMKEQYAPDLVSESPFISRSRHVEALKKARQHMSAGCEVLEADAAGELFAEELKLCHEALCEITGQFSSDDLLGEIFSSFCIGK